MQKFKRGSRVRVTNKMPSNMTHFRCGFDAIVEYTPKQASLRDKNYGSDQSDSKYSLLRLDSNGEPTGGCAWYPEETLTLLSDDIRAGLDTIEQYYFPQ